MLVVLLTQGTMTLLGTLAIIQFMSRSR